MPFNPKIRISYLDDGLIQICYGLKNAVYIQRNVLPEILNWCALNLPEAKIGEDGYNMAENKYYSYIHTSCPEDLVAFKLVWTT